MSPTTITDGVDTYWENRLRAWQGGVGVRTVKGFVLQRDGVHIDPAADEESQALLNKRRTAEVLDASEATLDGACESKHSEQEVAAR